MKGLSDPLQMLVNMSGAFPAIFNLIVLVFGLIGLLLFGMGLLDIYALSNQNSRLVEGNKTVAGVVTRLIAGSVLTCLTYFAVLTQNTMLGADAASGGMMYEAASGLNETQRMAVQAVFGIFQILGIIAFGRGWLILDKHNNGGREGWGTAIVFMLGGTAAIFLAEWLGWLSSWTGFNFMEVLLF